MGLAPSHQPAAVLLLLRWAWRVRSQAGALRETRAPGGLTDAVSDSHWAGPECLEGGSGLTAVGRVLSVRLWRRDLE